MRIGAKVPNSGPLPVERGIATMAAELEAAGFESLWVSDHTVMPRHIESRYPFAADGKPTWPSDTPYFDAMIALAVIATATQRAAIGTAVLVLPLRHPVILAKEAASIDVLSGGRLVLGVGAGWLAEEFDALDVPFASRGRRFIEWLQNPPGVLDRRAGPFRRGALRSTSRGGGGAGTRPRHPRSRGGRLPHCPVPGRDVRRRVARTSVGRGSGFRRCPGGGGENAPERQACRPSLGGTVDHCSHYRFF